MRAFTSLSKIPEKSPIAQGKVIRSDASRSFAFGRFKKKKNEELPNLARND